MEEPKIISIKELLHINNLQIPDYQRPYKWTGKNVNQLMDDILFHYDKSAYRIGTIVIHKDETNNLNIVDGQQRTITIFLMAYAFKTILEEKQDYRNYIISTNESIKDYLPSSDFLFKNDITKLNIHENYEIIKRRINDFSKEQLSFFYKKCEFVQVIITDISEAFQFFDSQNSRGKDLDPHDLLKAFHLREMNAYSTEQERINTVADWEALDTKNLSDLFSQYLFRIRNWSKGFSARYFTKNEVDCFKGVSPSIQEQYPFAQIYKIANYYTEEYNHSCHRFISGTELTFPYQIDQTIINGKRFFEMINYYENIIELIEDKNRHNPIFQVLNGDLENGINKYEGRNRTGDKYIYNLFMCALIYYYDKFGDSELDKAIQKIFIYAYSLRLKMQNVGLETIDNYALKKDGRAKVQIFKLIRESISPKYIINMQLETLSKNASSKTDAIVSIFKDLGYYYEQQTDGTV